MQGQSEGLPAFSPELMEREVASHWLNNKDGEKACPKDNPVLTIRCQPCLKPRRSTFSLSITGTLSATFFFPFPSPQLLSKLQLSWVSLLYN
jgi:hypothetical protein